ncbi:MAG TPA: hypothetical protein VFZ38_10780 [Vicinamibacterales bacterium]
MMFDSHNEFSDGQAVTATAISTNVIDLYPMADQADATRDIGTGEAVYVAIMTSTTITDAGSDATLVATLESDSTANLATAPVVHLSSGTLAFATYATAGSLILVARLPAGRYKRFLGVRYTVASGPFTGGSIDAFLTHDAQLYRAYADRQPITALA